MATTALITGASAGLGAQFAKLFARDTCDVVLVARRKDRLDALAAELSQAHGIKAHVLPVDLMAPDAAGRITAELEKWGVEVEFLVNNAGFGTTGRFWELEADKELGEVQVNIVTLVRLTRALLPGMVRRGRGHILNIGSTAGFQPGPFMATYYASKAFVNSFTEALAYELVGTGVTATVSCPGATATEFFEVAGNQTSRLFRMGTMTAEEVAGEAYRAMRAGRPLVVHGLKNKLAAFSVRLGPRGWVRAIAAAMNRPPNQRALKA
jgi:short-subunit dehydrogenase